jgi:hypothetical protein
MAEYRTTIKEGPVRRRVKGAPAGVALCAAALLLAGAIGVGTASAVTIPPSTSEMPITCSLMPYPDFEVEDPLEDTFGEGRINHDVTLVSSEADDSTVCLRVEFAGPIEPADSEGDRSLIGFIEFDTDEDSDTGEFPLTDYFCPDESGMGVEAWLDLRDVSDGAAAIGDEVVPVSFDGNAFTAAIPVSALGGDDSFNLAMVLGTPEEPTDCAPNGGSIHSPDGATS